MTKPKTDNIDPKAAVAEVFKRTGGIAGMTSWAKTHKTIFYNLYAKLISQPMVQNNVNVTVDRAGEEARARQHLQDAFERIIAARNGGPEEGAVYVDGELLIEHQRPSTALPPPGTADPRPATIHDVVAIIDDASNDASNDRQSYRREAAQRQREAADARRATDVIAAAPAAVDTEPSTTEKYLHWSNAGSWGRRGSDWSNNGGNG